MVFSCLLMVIIYRQVSIFVVLLVVKIFFVISKPFFTSVAASPKCIFFSSLTLFSTFPLYIKFRVRHWFWRAQVFVPLQLHLFMVILGWSNDLLCPAIIRKCFFRKLKNVCFYINRRWIEPNDLALSLFINNHTGGGFRCIYQVLCKSNFFQRVIVRCYRFLKYLHDNSDNLFPMDLGNSRIVVGGWINIARLVIWLSVWLVFLCKLNVTWKKFTIFKFPLMVISIPQPFEFLTLFFMLLISGPDKLSLLRDHHLYTAQLNGLEKYL